MAPLGGQVKKWAIGQAVGPAGSGAEVMPYASIVILAGSLAVSSCRDSNVNRGVLPDCFNAGSGSESYMPYGCFFIHSAPTTILVRNVAIDFPARFRISTNTPPPCGVCPAGSFMVHSDGRSNANLPSDVVNVFQPSGNVADGVAVRDAGLSVAVAVPLPVPEAASEEEAEVVAAADPPPPGEAGAPQPANAMTAAKPAASAKVTE
jgi:hypothetical protein